MVLVHVGDGGCINPGKLVGVDGGRLGELDREMDDDVDLLSILEIQN
jgi:hypothetical protein